jgi:hypothetical protein
VLYRVDTDTDAVAATIRFSGRNAGPVAVGEGAVWLVLTDRGGSSTSLARIDPATNSVERIVPLDGASGRYVDELATGQGAVWLLALRFGESGEQPGDVLRFDPGKNEIVATVHAEALNLGVGPGGVWVSGCVDRDQHRETFFAQKIDTVANAPVGPQVAVDGVSFGPLLVATDSVWFSGYGTQGETVAFRLDPDTHAIEPFLQLGDFLYTDAVLDERTDTLWVGAAPHSVVRADLEPAPSPTLGPGDGPSKPAVPLARLPYMGVSCDGRPNWIGCDRVGLYVYLDRHVARLSASIEGREVPMHPAHGGLDARYNWEGFLRPAGLIDGPLNVRPERGRYYWFGKTPVSGRVRLTIYSGNGASATRTLQLPLAPGYG